MSARHIRSTLVATVLAVAGATIGLTPGIANATTNNSYQCTPYTQATVSFKVCIENSGGSITGKLTVTAGTANGHLEIFEGPFGSAVKWSGCGTKSVTAPNSTFCSTYWGGPAQLFHASWVGTGGQYYPSPEIWVEP